MLAAKECCADALGKCATTAATTAATNAPKVTAASAAMAGTTTEATTNDESEDAGPDKGKGTGTGGPRQGGNLITKRGGCFLQRGQERRDFVGFAAGTHARTRPNAARGCGEAKETNMAATHTRLNGPG